MLVITRSPSRPLRSCGTRRRHREHFERALPGVQTHGSRISRIKGRTDDMLIIRGINVFPSQIETVLMASKKSCPTTS